MNEFPSRQGEEMIVFSDSAKSAHTYRPTFETTRPILAKTKYDEGASILSNWMVINGPAKLGNSYSPIPGTGFIEKEELRSSMAPSPVQIIDYELFKEHPAALKASRLHLIKNRSSPSLISAVQPNPEEMALLHDIVMRATRDFSLAEKELIFKYMWSLKDKKKALLKVLIVIAERTISSTDKEDEELLVKKILAEWAPPDIDTALALLGDEIGSSFSQQICLRIRSYAIRRFAIIASKQEIQLFMFQLVQALRYDHHTLSSPFKLAEQEESSTTMVSFLIQQSLKDLEIASSFFWHLQCEHDDVFKHVSQELWRELGRTEQGKKIRDGIDIQFEFRNRLLDISNLVVASTSGTLESLKDGIRGKSSTASSILGKLNLTNKLNFPQIGGEVIEISIPIDPTLSLIRIDEQKSFCIKSAKAPFVICCEVYNKRTNLNEIKRYMFKTGDDLRQDQLIIQLISLMDGLFKSYGLDLKLTPYRVLATSQSDGFVEFVPDSSTLSSILASNNNDLLAYFRSLRPRAENQFGVDPSVLDTFARSCAGYCAITYILGIGDRHMDNLLITSDGRLFHVDFGYILGRDPKPFPPPMKLCREMVEAMGGTNSIYYRSFVSKCTQAFLIMRRHASLLISLLYLAADANLKDMREQDPTLAILKVQKRLMPEVSDEVAEQQMISLINESTSALFPVVMEKLHKWAIYWRN
jgi:phosphatidylinositol 3-kinase